MKQLAKLILIFLLSTPLFAQQDAKIAFGVRAGVNRVFQYKNQNSSFVNFDNEFGYYLGGVSSFKISVRSSLVGEILLSRHRNSLNFIVFDTQSSSTVVGFLNEGNYNQTIIHLPMLYRINFLKRISFNAGFQGAYILSTERQEFQFPLLYSLDDVALLAERPITQSDFSFGRKRVEIDTPDTFGIDLLVGLNVSIIPKLFLDCRYYYGITERNDLRPSVFQFGLGYQL